MAVECVVKHAAKSAAEGPHWDDITNTLLFVDILENTVHRYYPETGTVDVIQLGKYKQEYYLWLGKYLL